MPSSLGAHWIYSQREIAEKFGHITGYATPATSYHPGKQAGDFTHYGDQTMVLLRSLAAHGRFDLADFARRVARVLGRSRDAERIATERPKPRSRISAAGLPPAQSRLLVQ